MVKKMTHNEMLDFAIKAIGRGDDNLERLKAYRAPFEEILAAQRIRDKENEIKEYLRSLKEGWRK
jgi:hypothetical protein